MRPRKILRFLTVLAVAYGCLEGLSFVLYSGVHGSWFSFADVGRQRATVLASRQSAAPAPHNVHGTYQSFTAHPYVGFVREQAQQPAPDGSVITPYGLWAEQDPLVAGNDPANVMVAITGGSYSESLFHQSRAVLREQLQKAPGYRNRPIVFFMLGMELWHQPQQAMSVAYYLAQGGRLDVLINLDGFNEASQPSILQRQGVYPLYPILWPELMHGHFDSDSFNLLSRLALWQRARLLLAEAFKPLRFSVTASVLWSWADGCAARKIAAQIALKRQQDGTRPYYATGPDTMTMATPQELAGFMAGAWERASLQLHYLSRFNRFQYFHFLQPSPYVLNSKPLNAGERAHAYAPHSEAASDVAISYPLYLRRMESLHRKGVDITSLVALYKTTAEAVYLNACCRLTQQGSDLLAHAIGAHISDAISHREP